MKPRLPSYLVFLVSGLLVPALANPAEKGTSVSELQEPTSAHYHRGLEAFQRGDTTEAIRELRLALTDSSQSAAVHHLLGLALQQDGQADAAVEEFRQTISLAPGF